MASQACVLHHVVSAGRHSGLSSSHEPIRVQELFGNPRLAALVLAALRNMSFCFKSAQIRQGPLWRGAQTERVVSVKDTFTLSQLMTETETDTHNVSIGAS